MKIDLEYLNKKFGAPIICPSCGQPLIIDGIFIKCINKNCPIKILNQIALFLKKLEIKFVSVKTLENFNIYSFDDLLNFKILPNCKYKSKIKFYNELTKKMFTASPKKLLSSLNFQGLAENLLNTIIDHFGFENLKNINITQIKESDFPYGVGKTMFEKFLNDLEDNLKIVSNIISDPRWNYSNINKNILKNGKSFCFTGKLNTLSRLDAEKLAIQNGYEIKTSVTKNLTYLVNNDFESTSIKNKKAKKIGIKIISENEFLKLVSNINENEVSLNDL